jgi:hypothetical protein
MAQTNIQHIPGKATVTGNLNSSLVGNVTGNISGSVSSTTNATYATTAGAATNVTYATDAGAADTVAFTDRDSQDETDYIAFVSSHSEGNKALRTDVNLSYNPYSHYLNANVPYATNATNAAGPNGAHELDTGVVASTIVKRDGAADIAARLFSSSYQNQNTISGALAHRRSTNDNYIRFCSNMGNIRTFIGAPSRTGGGATGEWNININGSAANVTYAADAGSVTNATYAVDAGSSTHANKANAVAFTDRDSSNNTDYIAFVDSHAAEDKALFTDSNLTYNSSTNHINANVPYANNAGNLGGKALSTSANANSIVQRTTGADVYMNHGFATYFNMSHATGTRNGDTVFYSSNDSYIRKTTASGMRAALNVPQRGGGSASGTWSININGNAAHLGQSNARGWTPVVHITGSANHSHRSWSWKKLHANGISHALSNFSDNDGDDGFDGDYPPPSQAPAMNAAYGFMGSNWIITNEWLFKVSDRRIKDDIVPIETDYALSKVNKLRPVSFIKKDTRQPEYGFIAQEVQEVIPESVSKTTGIVGNICEFGKFSGRRLINEDERHILSEDTSGSYSNIYEYTMTTFNPIPDTFDASTTAIFRIDQHNPNRVKNVCIDALYEPEISGQVYTPPGYGDQSTSIIKLLISEDDIEGINEQETYRLYGTGVEDMRALGGDSILSMVTASVQEIDKLRLHDQAKITSLEAKCKEVSEILDTLESN